MHVHVNQLASALGRAACSAVYHPLVVYVRSFEEHWRVRPSVVTVVVDR